VQQKMRKKMKKKGGFALSFHGQRADTPLLYFLKSLFGIRSRTKIFFGCIVVKLLNKLREPVKGY